MRIAVNNTPRKFRFIITSKYGVTVCDKSPREWKDAVSKLARRFDVAGVFASYAVDRLTFFGKGAKVLRDVFDSDQIQGEATLTVKRLNKQTMNYENFPATYSFKFGSFGIVKVGKFAIGVSIGVTDTSALSRFDERKKTKIDLTRLETIGGVQITEFAGFPLLSKMRMPAINSSFRAVVGERGVYVDDVFYFTYTLVKGYNSIPANIISSDFSEPNNIPMVQGATAITNLAPIFRNATENRTLDVSFTLYINVDNGFGVFNKDAIDIRYAVYNGNTQVSDQSWNNPDQNPFGQHNALRKRQGRFTVTLNEGEKLYFYVKVAATTGVAHFVRPSTGSTKDQFATSVQIKQTVVNTPEKIVYGLPVYNALTRAAQLVLDNENAFHSDFFGSGDSRRNAHICSGLNLRGLTIFDRGGSINIQPDRLLASISAMYCTGYCVQRIGGFDVLRVENRDYFFNTNVILDLSDRIGKYDIEREYMPEQAYIEILTGYENFTFETTNGRGEYNTESTFTTQLKATEVLDLKSDLNTSTISITKCIAKPIDVFGDEDTEEDEKVFFVKSQSEDESTHKWVAETDELITVENNSSLFKDSSLNLYVSPGRNLIRNAELFTPALQKLMSSKIRFQTSSKLSNLETTGEGYTVQENQDIAVNSLPTPKVLPIKLKAECLLTYGEFATLYAVGADDVENRYKLIKFANNLYGFILSVEMKLNEDKAMIELIMFNNEHSTPIE